MCKKINNKYSSSSIITAGSAAIAGECTLDYDVIMRTMGVPKLVTCYDHVMST